MSVAIDIAIEHEAWGEIGDLDDLAARAVAAALVASGKSVPDGAELSIVLCDDAFIRDLNKTWRGKDKATNVLSFPLTEAAREASPDPMLGDIVIAYETSAREAEDEGKSLRDHLTHLVVHGFFHLLGFDHEAENEADAMERLESRALMTLGIASPYQDAEDTRASP